uniref:Uncharacterized protein n=1 Tax=viral metagenome TaxID=1070528 RepID=A0A6C0EBZ6_9ZZZZ
MEYISDLLNMLITTDIVLKNNILEKVKTYNDDYINKINNFCKKLIEFDDIILNNTFQNIRTDSIKPKIDNFKTNIIRLQIQMFKSYIKKDMNNDKIFLTILELYSNKIKNVKNLLNNDNSDNFDDDDDKDDIDINDFNLIDAFITSINAEITTLLQNNNLISFTYDNGNFNTLIKILISKLKNNKILNTIQAIINTNFDFETITSSIKQYLESITKKSEQTGGGNKSLYNTIFKKLLNMFDNIFKNVISRDIVNQKLDNMFQKIDNILESGKQNCKNYNSSINNYIKAKETELSSLKKKNSTDPDVRADHEKIENDIVFGKMMEHKFNDNNIFNNFTTSSFKDTNVALISIINKIKNKYTNLNLYSILKFFDIQEILVSKSKYPSYIFTWEKLNDTYEYINSLLGLNKNDNINEQFFNFDLINEYLKKLFIENYNNDFYTKYNNFTFDLDKFYVNENQRIIKTIRTNIVEEIKFINLKHYYNDFYNIIIKIIDEKCDNIALYLDELNDININFFDIKNIHIHNNFNIIEKKCYNSKKKNIYMTEITDILSSIKTLFDVDIKLSDIGLDNGDLIPIDKLIKIRCLKHKLLYDRMVLSKTKNDIPSITDFLQTKDVNLYNIWIKNVIPTYNYVNCIKDEVQKQVLDKVRVLSPKLSSFITATNFLYYSYTTYVKYDNFIKIFFNKFFKNNRCYFITDNYIKLSNDKIEYSYLIFDIIKNQSDKRYFFIKLILPGHANILIIDRDGKNIFHFEPNSFNFYLEDNILLKNWLIDGNLEETIKLFINSTSLEKKKKSTGTALDESIMDSYFYEYKLLLLFHKFDPKYKYFSAYSVIRPDNMLIPFTSKSMIDGVDPGGYCKTLTYFYIFLIMINLNNSNDICDNPDKISILMIKWINYTESIDLFKKNETMINMVRNFAIIIFQYYYKFISTMFDGFKIITIDNLKMYDVATRTKIASDMENFKNLKFLDTKCIDKQKLSFEYFNINHIRNIQYNITDQQFDVQLIYNNRKTMNNDTKILINYTEKDCNSNINRELAKWYFFNTIFFNNKYNSYKTIFSINNIYNKADENEKTISWNKTIDVNCQSRSPFKKKYLKYKIKYLKLTNLTQ